LTALRVEPAGKAAAMPRAKHVILANRANHSIADRLNEEGQTTRRGRPWNQVQVMRVLERVEQPA
jgi:hypothetical protein